MKNKYTSCKCVDWFYFVSYNRESSRESVEKHALEWNKQKNVHSRPWCNASLLLKQIKAARALAILLRSFLSGREAPFRWSSATSRLHLVFIHVAVTAMAPLTSTWRGPEMDITFFNSMLRLELIFRAIFYNTFHSF